MFTSSHNGGCLPISWETIDEMKINSVWASRERSEPKANKERLRIYREKRDRS